jgi:hypothetical protein
LTKDPPKADLPISPFCFAVSRSSFQFIDFLVLDPVMCSS